MHKKYAGDGLIAVSVDLGDNPDDKKARARVDEFLRDKQADFTNLIAEGNPEDWYTKLNAGAIPLVYVFDRDNHRVKKLEGEAVKYEAIEAEVADLLKKK